MLQASPSAMCFYANECKTNFTLVFLTPLNRQILDEFKPPKQGWLRLASKDCWAGTDIVGKLEYCIVKKSCVGAFRSGQTLIENEDYFTSRWGFWKHHRGEKHSKNAAFQVCYI